MSWSKKLVILVLIGIVLVGGVASIQRATKGGKSQPSPSPGPVTGDQRREAIKKACEQGLKSQQDRAKQQFDKPARFSDAQARTARGAEARVKEFLLAIANPNKEETGDAEKARAQAQLNNALRGQFEKTDAPGYRDAIGLARPAPFEAKAVSVSQSGVVLGVVSVVVVKFQADGGDQYTSFGVEPKGAGLISFIQAHSCNDQAINYRLQVGTVPGSPL